MGRIIAIDDLTSEERVCLERNRLLRRKIHELSERNSEHLVPVYQHKIAVIFDLDNTLIDRRKTIRSYSYFFYNDFRHQLLATTATETVFQVLLEEDRYGYRGHRERSKAIVECPIWAEPIEFEVLVEHWKSKVPTLSEPMDGLIEVLDKVYLHPQTHCLGLITNGSSQAQRTKIEKLQIEQYFESVKISEEVGLEKPDPRIFTSVVEKWDIEPEHCIYIGDDPINDYDGALNAGITPIWIRSGREWCLPYEPKHTIKTLAELPAYLNVCFKRDGD